MEEIILKLDKGWQYGDITLNARECETLLKYI